MNKINLFTFGLALSLGSLFGQGQVTITDADLVGNTTYNWTKNNEYLLDGFVFVESGSTLNIEEGTVIKAKETPSTADNASALIITQGAKINAVGTAAEPVIFTTEYDDVNDNTDLLATDRGLWGGLIILGYGQLAFQSPTANVEGIPTTETRAVYGGSDDSDNSGTLRYVSIRHGGAELSPGDEINGLTLGGVGSATTIEFVEVFANQDDGIEWFGGAVECKNLIVSYCGDDCYDYDFGWRGKGQFWFALVGEDDGDNAGEHDGAKPDGASPYSNPTIYNATYIGAGVGAVAKNSTAIHFRDASAGTYANSIFTDFANAALEVEDLPASSGVDSRKRMEDGELNLLNNIWYNFGSGNQISADSLNGVFRATGDAEDPNCQFLIDHFNNNSNELANPLLGNISRSTSQVLNPIPDVNGPAYQNLALSPSGSFFENVNYKGAFGDNNWAINWTAISSYGYMENSTSIEEKVTGLPLRFYPNPSAGSLFFDNNEDWNVLSVINTIGQEVLRVELEKQINVNLDLSTLENGVYTIVVTKQNISQAERIQILK